MKKHLNKQDKVKFRFSLYKKEIIALGKHKINQLYKISKKIDFKINLFRPYIEETFDDYKRSLLDVIFISDNLKSNEIIEQIKYIYNKSKERLERIEKIRTSKFKIHHSPEEQRLNLELNLMNI